MAVALLASLAIAACGSSNSSSATHGASTIAITDKVRPGYKAPSPGLDPIEDYAKSDSDKDNDIEAAGNDDSNNDSALLFGKAAPAAERKAIGAMVERYYAIALTGNGARGCSLLYSTLAEAAAEDYAVPGGPEYIRGAKNCTEVLGGIFKHYHHRLSVLVPKLRVSRVRLQGGRGYALLSFPPFAERELPVTREGRVWRIGAFLDSELP